MLPLHTEEGHKERAGSDSTAIAPALGRRRAAETSLFWFTSQVSDEQRLYGQPLSQKNKNEKQTSKRDILLLDRNRGDSTNPTQWSTTTRCSAWSQVDWDLEAAQAAHQKENTAPPTKRGGEIIQQLCFFDF